MSWSRVRRPGGEIRGRPSALGVGRGRSGRADAAQPARVPHRRLAVWRWVPLRSRSTTRLRPSRSAISSTTARHRSPWSRTATSWSGCSRRPASALCCASVVVWATPRKGPFRGSRSPAATRSTLQRLRPARPDVAADGDLHLGHDRAAQGRDDHPRQRHRRVDRVPRATPAVTLRRGSAAGLVSADGARRRADGHPLQPRPARLRGRTAARTWTSCRRTWLRFGRHALFGPPRVWEKLVAGIQAAGRGTWTRRPQAQFEDALKVGRQVQQLRAQGEEPPASWPRPGSSSTRWSFAPIRAAIGLDEAEFVFSRRGAGAARGHQLPARHRAADERGLRHERELRRDDVGAVPGQGRAGSARPTRASR